MATNTKQKMTDEERQELANKLDDDFDVYLDSLIEKNKDSKTGSKPKQTVEEFEKELRLNPMFLTEMPTQEEIDSSVQLSALQAIKYETEDPIACATAHKEDGNYHFKLKKYELAIAAYTEGLKQEAADAELNAILLTNRAAAQFYLENYRSSLLDATLAIKNNPSHIKAIIRACHCCLSLEKPDSCLIWCEKGLSIEEENTSLKECKHKAEQMAKLLERNARREEMKQKKKTKEKHVLLQALTERHVTLEDTGKEVDDVAERLAAVDIHHPHQRSVYLDEDQSLHWPVYFLYPEFSESDFIEDFHENASLADHIKVMFSEESPPPWDTDNHYTPECLLIFFEDRKREMLIQVKSKYTLKNILADKRYVVLGGAPSFLVLSSKSPYTQELFKKAKIEPF